MSLFMQKTSIKFEISEGCFFLCSTKLQMSESWKLYQEKYTIYGK